MPSFFKLFEMETGYNFTVEIVYQKYDMELPVTTKFAL